VRSEGVPLSQLATFRLARFRLRLKAKEMLYLPAYKGSALRGGFGQVFRQIACLGANRGFGECLLGERCPYHYIFETPPPAGSVILDKVPTAPQPFVLEPPLETKRVYEPDEEFVFHLVLVGKALDYLPYFIYAFDELGRVGLGRGKGKYTLEAVAWLDAAGSAVPVYDGRRKVLTDSFSPLSLSQLSVSDSGSQLLTVQTKALAAVRSESFASVRPEPFDYAQDRLQRGAPKSKDAQDRLRASEVEERDVWHANESCYDSSPSPVTISVSFLTPTRLKYENQLATDCEFHVLFRSLVRRIALLDYFHCGGEFPPERREFVDRARAVETVASDLRWVDWERYSNRQQTRMRLGGFVGQVTYRGDFIDFLPYLLLGTYTHVGKGATFGLGGMKWPCQLERGVTVKEVTEVKRMLTSFIQKLRADH